MHCSAGPLEAMVEYCRFFSDHAGKSAIKPTETPFGELLAGHGLSEKAIVKLAKNPLLGKEGDGNYAFNLTEEKDFGGRGGAAGEGGGPGRHRARLGPLLDGSIGPIVLKKSR